jgi:hypothetical protein
MPAEPCRYLRPRYGPSTHDRAEGHAMKWVEVEPYEGPYVDGFVRSRCEHPKADETDQPQEFVCLCCQHPKAIRTDQPLDHGQARNCRNVAVEGCPRGLL